MNIIYIQYIQIYLPWKSDSFLEKLICVSEPQNK